MGELKWATIFDLWQVYGVAHRNGPPYAICGRSQGTSRPQLATICDLWQMHWSVVATNRIWWPVLVPEGPRDAFGERNFPSVLTQVPYGGPLLSEGYLAHERSTCERCLCQI